MESNVRRLKNVCMVGHDEIVNGNGKTKPH